MPIIKAGIVACMAFWVIPYSVRADSSPIAQPDFRVSAFVTEQRGNPYDPETMPVNTGAQTSNPVLAANTGDVLINDSDEEELIFEDQKASDSKKDTTAATKKTEEKSPSSPTPSAETSPVRQTNDHPEAVRERTRMKMVESVDSTHVEQAGSINFAKNLSEYRSPRLAMLYSLLVPGLGQVYARRYIKASLFCAAEFSGIGLAVFYNNKGKKQREKADRFADAHYSETKMNAYVDSLYKAIKTTPNMTEKTVDSILEAVYPENYDTTTNGFQSTWYHSGDRYSQFEDGRYVQGWDDCVPTIGEIIEAVNGNLPFVDSVKYDSTYRTNLKADTIINRYKINRGDETLCFGFSVNQETYREMVNQSRDYYTTSVYMLVALLVNHVVSAIDAGLSARAYNEQQLGKQSLWQRFDLQPYTTEHRTGLAATGCIVKYRF